MVKFPEIKKKLKNFVQDEKGTISKKNLIKGGIILSMIGSISKKVVAHPSTHHNYIRDDTSGSTVSGTRKNYYTHTSY